MASDNSQLAVAPDLVRSRSIPLEAVMRPKPHSSPSTSFNSSDATTTPETPASESSPVTDVTSFSPSHSLSSCPTTRSSGVSAIIEDNPFPLPFHQLQPSSTSSTTTPQSAYEDSQRSAPPPRGRAWRQIPSLWDSRQTWVQSSIGIAGLVVALVGLFVYALRGYELAKWTAYNDLLQSCAALVQAQIDGGPRCEKVLHDGPRERPYGKRDIPAYVRNRQRGLRGQIIGWSDGVFKIPPGFDATGFQCLERCTWHDLRDQIIGWFDRHFIAWSRIYTGGYADFESFSPKHSIGLSWDSVGTLALLSCFAISLVVWLITVRRQLRAESRLKKFREQNGRRDAKRNLRRYYTKYDNPLRNYPDDSLIEELVEYFRGGHEAVSVELLKGGALLAYDSECGVSHPRRLNKRAKTGTRTTIDLKKKIA